MSPKAGSVRERPEVVWPAQEACERWAPALVVQLLPVQQPLPRGLIHVCARSARMCQLGFELQSRTAETLLTPTFHRPSLLLRTRTNTEHL